jgi:hypothetical protein
MTTRTTTRLVTFRKTFSLAEVDRTLPPGDYRVDIDEDLIDGLSFVAWRRTSTIIHLPAQSHPAGWSESVIIDPQNLQQAQDRDAGEMQASAPLPERARMS